MVQLSATMEQTHETQLVSLYDVLDFRRVIASSRYETGPSSLRNKTLLVRDYVDDCSADIVALTETWLGDEDKASVSELCIDTFSFAHQPRGGARRVGGTGVLFRQSFQLVSRVTIDTRASNAFRHNT